MRGPSYVKRMLHGSELEGSLTIRPIFCLERLVSDASELMKNVGEAWFLERWSAGNVVVGAVVIVLQIILWSWRQCEALLSDASGEMPLWWSGHG